MKFSIKSVTVYFSLGNSEITVSPGSYSYFLRDEQNMNIGSGTDAVVVQLQSHVKLFATPWTVARQASLSFTISRSLLKLMSITLMMPSNHLILSPPSPPALNLPASGSFPMSQPFAPGGQIFELQLQHQSFQFRNSGLISFRINWYDLLAIQGTLKSSLASVQKHQFFGAQPSSWYNSHIRTRLLKKP